MKKSYLLASLLLMTLSNILSAQDKPEDTEVWEPEPKVISPGYSYASAPSDAIVLFSENNLDQWTNGDGQAPGWDVSGDIFTVVPKSGQIQTKEVFEDFQLHIEWRSPLVIQGEGQGRGNSGIFLQGKYELQVLDSYNNRTYSNGQAASIYKQAIPLVNATQPTGNWNSYDVIYTAPKFNENGELKSPAYVTVLHNGVLVQNHTEIKGRTAFIGQPKYEAHGPGPILLQDHSNPVSYRNIWIRRL
ncbi:3-keto-disaccharide hydrolase [Membranihabitans marinus]|uniref:3-keto-disaccharide hydrolase n=1 Tax=Membranihabitans marinus TaxID=1227546 RepID=UPI001F1AAA40|nr:DUF1080 domain-containing protein [Membranihabitans marinus]